MFLANVIKITSNPNKGNFISHRIFMKDFTQIYDITIPYIIAKWSIKGAHYKTYAGIVYI